MLNSIVLIGIKKSDTYALAQDDIHFSIMLIEIQRPYHNSDGTLTMDKVIVKVFRGVADEIDDKYPIGSLLAIKGRIEESKDNMCIVVAEKIVFINDELKVE